MEAWGAAVVGLSLERGLMAAWLVLMALALRPDASWRARLLLIGLVQLLVPPLFTLPLPRPTLAVELGGRTVLADTTTALAVVAWAQAAGALVGTLLFLRSRDAVRRALHRAHRVDRGPVLEILAGEAARQGVPTPRLFITHGEGPGATGIVHPTVLIPRDLTERLGPEQLRMVVAHEVAHIARRDAVADLVRRAALAVWWFHPAAWLLARLHRSAAEDACDDAAAGPDPAAYCQTILRAVGPSTPPTDTPDLAMARFGGHALERRFRRLLRPDADRLAAWVGPRLAPWILAAVVAAALMAAPLRFLAIEPVPAGWSDFDPRETTVIHHEVVIRY